MPRALRFFYQLLGLTFVLLGAAVWLGLASWASAIQNAGLAARFI